MSASSKKKLRNEQEAAKLTERQLAEQKEAKNLKIYTTVFVVVLAALLVFAAVVGVNQIISNSGIREKNTVAMTINGHDISNAELNYYYISTINNFYSQNGSYISLLGLDTTKALDEQIMDEATGMTWADYFLDSAKNSAATIYAMKAAAEAAGFTADEAMTASVDSTMESLSLYAMVYGYSDAETYLKAMYGKGATLESYRTYVEDTMLADAYYVEYGESLTYEDADLRAAEAENFDAYSAFTYNYYYLPTSKFLEGGTTAEDGTTTYSEEEKSAAVAAAEEAAKALTGKEITSAEELDAAIAALPVNADVAGAVSTFYSDNAYSYITEVVADWLSDDNRKEGDLTYLANSTTADDGTETINGYYVIYFHSVNDNAFALKNVRHILAKFEGGTTDEATGVTTYSDEEKAAAKAEAEEILAAFQSGNATEADFAGLAAEKTDDTASASNGGLYEDVYPGQMVAAFEDWCYDNSRKAGDIAIVETEYGYHIMYFVGNSDVTYRDYLISNELRSNDLSVWYAEVLETVDVVEGNTDYVSKGLILNAG